MRLRTDRERAAWAAVYAMHVEGRECRADVERRIEKMQPADWRERAR